MLRRNGWQCRSCGTMSNLKVDHKQFRSHSGQGAEENLITLCFKCHALIHGHNLSRLNQLNGDRDPSLPANSLIRRSTARPVRGIEIDEVNNDLIWCHATDQTVFVNLRSDDYHGSTLDDFFELRR